MAEGCRHEESWLLLPWLVNGRLSQRERARVEDHVRGCAECRQEIALQRLVCHTLTTPERVTYAPGPSFRKLMNRIDGLMSRIDGRVNPRGNRQAARTTRLSPQLLPPRHAAAWRPPGLAWAASFVLMMGLGVLAATLYHWSQPLYATHTDITRSTPDVLHIAFVPSLSVGEAGELLRSVGARVVEGPGETGIFGVALVTPIAHGTADAGSAPLHALAARLRADPRVRWVEPLAGDAQPLAGDTPPAAPAGSPVSTQRGPPQP